MKALSMWQPWASLLACGAKQYETRSWATKYRGPIAIHAALKDPQILHDALPSLTQVAMSEFLLPLFAYWDDVPRGCIIATAELVGCWKMWDGQKAGYGKGVVCVDRPNQYWSPNWMGVTNEYLFGDWTPGRYAWEFANMRMLDKPIPSKGRQGLWNWEMTEEGATT